MLQKVVLVSLLVCCQHATAYKKLDFKLITAVRHGLDRSLDYINDNVYRVNVDCVLGVAFVRGFMRAAFKNGTHIMDNSSERLLDKCEDIIAKSKWRFWDDFQNGRNWSKFELLRLNNIRKVSSLEFKHLVEADIWSKPMSFEKRLILLPSWSPNSGPLVSPNSDKCLQEIINSSSSLQDVSAPCAVSTDCWNLFFRNGAGSGYYLTHKLLLLQIARARNCWLSPATFQRQTREICSAIMSEIINANSNASIEEMFDLFLEQVLLCGYEGFSEFIQNDWLFHILKSQRFSGCFVDHLTDELKSRIKRDVNYFEDGCNDHTTGLGAAVLGLYYVYIVNE
ncbi:UPF0764 protein C16orf89 homolog isoform X1 [Dendroctonus ponderosae]|uniref:UPF0764 protein C16orf89 homolog isoform X1 n=1 Tax=Dendroctonus ponderosae TaxID=77166 RepID=UPI002034E092|nr:UPF0764 protein C16orf89 homolog isoform X1 [Dendroctonus ponderosae]XP_048520249.1 UPF0764 protein C16orf89 homolog isoform X1 [Dendroctonus ponderosae]XP_048520250.1 UPF0764 protein C16orf89 homolog isoform X1 [Dendroctonus ponderosae]